MVKKTKYVFVSCKQSEGQNHSIKTCSKSFESVTKLKYLGTNLMSQNFIHEVIERRPNSGTAFYILVQNFLPYSLLPKSMKIKIIQNYNFFLFYMYVKLGLSHWVWNTRQGYLRIGCWGRYLGLRGIKWQTSMEENV
jgi:hypothetical protein